MLRKLISLSLLFVLVFASHLLAGNLRVNNKDAEDRSTVNLFSGDLDGGKVVFSLEGKELNRAEISFDRGKSWADMKKEGDRFTYGYRPSSDEIISPEFILHEAGGQIRTLKPYVRVDYQRQNPDQAIEVFLERMKTFYQDESKDRFLGLISSMYPDRIKFEQAIQNDFYNYTNIRLFYRVDQKTFDEDYRGAMLNVYWEKRNQDRSGVDSSSAANITMRMEKEGNDWVLTGMRNNTIFGSSLLTSNTAIGQPDLSISSTDISFTNGGAGSGNVSIVATVHNSGSASAQSVLVNFYQRNPPGVGAYTLIGSRTVSTISASSQANTAAISFSGTPAFNYEFQVVVDPNNTIGETDETNNTATATHALP